MDAHRKYDRDIQGHTDNVKEASVLGLMDALSEVLLDNADGTTSNKVQ